MLKSKIQIKTYLEVFFFENCNQYLDAILSRLMI